MMDNKTEECIDLPPGFRFHPTDEEIISHYLCKKVFNPSFTATAIGEVDLNKIEPWDLPSKAKMGEKEWYFFCQRDRKYPTGMRTNRATEAGYWKATGKDKEIYNKMKVGCLVGMKKTLVFYKGRAPKGEKTNWVMHEFRLDGKFSYNNLPKSAKVEWVVCRVVHKNSGIKKIPYLGPLRMDSFGLDDFLINSPSLPPLLDHHSNFNNTNPNRPSSSYTNNNNFEVPEYKSTKVPITRFTDGNQLQPYISSTMNYHHHEEQDNKNFLPSNPLASNSIFYLQTPISNMGYLNQDQRINNNNNNMNGIPSFPSTYFNNDPQDQAILRDLSDQQPTNEKYDLRKQFKVEQFTSNNNHSMISHSQDTGLSTAGDMNTTEISSVHEVGNDYQDDLEGPSSNYVVDLDCLWNY